MAHRNDIQELVDNWIWWVKSRHYYAPPLPHNILARMQVDRRPSKEPPNARNDALCAAFNMVICIAEPESRLPFLYVYAKKIRPAPIKTLAAELNLDRATIYNRAHESAVKFYNQAIKLAEINSKFPDRADANVEY